MAPPLRLPPTSLGEPQRSFSDHLALDQIDGYTFLSTAGTSGKFKVPFKGGFRDRAYGGHVYAQAAWAAAQTVASGFVLHSVSGYFVSAGWADVPFVYRVKVVRDGKSYVVRSVEVSQLDTEGLCFTCTCSFKSAEKNLDTTLDVQDPIAPEERYKDLLKGKKPHEYGELVFDGDESFWKCKERGFTNSLPSLKIGILPMDEYNDPKHPLDRRALFYYSVPGGLPSIDMAPNLHVAYHLYCADRAAVFIIAQHYEVLPYIKTFASLSATIIFHCGAEALALFDKDGNERWFCQEVFTRRVGDGRGMHQSRIWDDQGRHIATTMQDAQIKLDFKSKDEFNKAKSNIESKAKI